MSTRPLVSIVMPAYNAAAFISDAISSVLAQTYEEFELVVVNDGSTDATADAVASFSDGRIRLFTLAKNSGLAAARNEGILRASGDFVAWLDADDLSHPHRLRHQVAYMTRHRNVGICGTWVRAIGGVRTTVWRYPRNPRYIYSQMLFDDPLATSSVMMRREALDGLDHWFASEFSYAEDYDLWERVAGVWDVVNLPRVLATYRVHDSQVSNQGMASKEEAIMRVQGRQLKRLGLAPTPTDWRMHFALGVRWGSGLDAQELSTLEHWLTVLEEANEQQRVYPRRSFRQVLRQRHRLVLNHLQPSISRRIAAKFHTAAH